MRRRLRYAVIEQYAGGHYWREVWRADDVQDGAPERHLLGLQGTAPYHSFRLRWFEVVSRRTKPATVEGV